MVVVVALVDFVFGATYVVHMTTSGVSPAIIGTMLAVAGILSFVLEIPSGALADRYGNKRVLVVGLIGWGAAQAAFGLAHTAIGAGASLLLLNVGLALYSGAPISYTINALRRTGLADQAPAVARAGNTWRWVGAGVGGVAVYAWGTFLGLGAVLAVSGVVLLVAAAWVALTWTSEPRSSNGPSTAVDHLARSLRQSWHFVVSETGRRLSLAYVGLGFGQGVLVLVWQPRFLESGMVPSGALGLVLVALMLGAAAGSTASKVLDRANAAVATSAALIVIAVGLAATTVTSPAAVLGFLVAEFGIGAAGAVVTALGQSLFEDEKRNTLTSSMAAVMTLAVAVAQFVAGLVWDGHGVGAASAFGAAAVALAAGGAFLLGPARARSATQSLTDVGGNIDREDQIT
ncbi:MFS transporter [Actinotalea sp. C106]|uniref:MFS transporter n=1 Tax=Actinotalea sp. C106 TaxID=2908644 RepID=UPI002028A3BF|nr:MFS transporter [Actinotalea sp. C106]